MEDKRILLIEDSDLDAELTIEGLADSDYTINHVKELEEVNEALNLNSYRLVITDYNLVTYTALDVIEVFKRRGLDVPIICLTGAIGEERAASLFRYGIQGYLLKENIDKLPRLLEDISKAYDQEKQMKLMQDRIEQSEKKYRSLFNNLPIGVAEYALVFDDHDRPIDFRMTELNKMAESILEFERALVIGRTSSEIYEDQPSFFETYINFHQTPGTIQFEAYCKEVDKYLDITLFSTEPDKFVTIFADITERVETEIQSRNNQRLEAVGSLASGVAHEVNNPINGILNYSQIIMDISDINSETYEFAKIINDESLRIAETTRSLLEFSRRDGDSSERVLLDDILQQAISLAAASFKKDQIVLEIDLNTPISIQCHPQQIQQIIMNLLLNARYAVLKRYEVDNKIMVIRVSSMLLKKDDGQHIRVMVEDNGCGIPEDVQDNIFDPFFTTKGRTEGTGLGLPISQRIARAHNGNISFETEENVFTRFYLELPPTCFGDYCNDVQLIGG